MIRRRPGTRDVAARRAAEVIERFGFDGPPVAVEGICNALGIRVVARTFDYVAGVFIKDDVFPVIVVNARERKARQRFTIAHELGHYFLGHRRRAFPEPDRAGRQEREAERFAACLLMPERWMRAYWRAYAANPDNRRTLLASLFNVSLAALNVRVKELAAGGVIPLDG